MIIILKEINKNEKDDLFILSEYIIKIKKIIHQISTFLEQNNIIISEEEINILLLINYFKKSNQVKINAILNINKATAGRMFCNLEKKNLIKRKTNENNRRENIVSLTKKSKDIFENINL